MILPVLTLCVTATMCATTSAQPAKLSLNVTRDVTLTCTMAGFDRNMSRLLSLQLIAMQWCGTSEPLVCASVDYKAARTSFRFRRYLGPFYLLSGKFDSRRQRASWLKLTIYDFERLPGYTGFSCRVNYLQQPTDTQQSSGEAGVPVNTSHVPVSTRHHEGFNKTVRRGVHAVCTHNGTMSYSALHKEDGTILASSSGYDRSKFYTIRTTRFNRHGVFEAHLPEISCEDSWKCRCSVRTSSGSMLSSSSQTLPRYDCWQVPKAESDSPPPSELTKGKSINTAETAPLKHFTVGILVSVLGAVVIVAVVGFVVLRLKKARRACFKRKRTTGGDDSDDDGEALNGDAATEGDTKDVDMKQRAEEERLSVNSDTVSIAGSITDMRLHLRPETSSV